MVEPPIAPACPQAPPGAAPAARLPQSAVIPRVGCPQPRLQVTVGLGILITLFLVIIGHMWINYYTGYKCARAASEPGAVPIAPCARVDPTAHAQ